MDAVIIAILNGISWGVILFLIASGLSLIYGVMGILNLAHGTLYALGAFVGLTVTMYSGNFGLGLLCGALGAALFGFILERGFLSRLHNQINEQVLLTLGFVYIFTNAALWVWGPIAKMGTPPSVLSGTTVVGDFHFPIYRLAVIIFGLLLAIGLWWCQDKTRVGAIMRAGMEDKEMIIGLGMNYRLISTAVFVLGAFLGGFAGFVGAPIFGVHFAMSFDILLLAMIVIVIGGVGTIQGTLLGAILVGLIDTVGKSFFPDFALFSLWAAFIVVLLVKPSGLLGRG